MSALYDTDFEYTELGMKEEREYFAKKMKQLQFLARQEEGQDVEMDEEMQELMKEIEDYERLYEDEQGEHEDDAFDYEMRAHQEMYDASVIEDARISLARDAEMRNFVVHQKNVRALAKYHDAVAIGTRHEDTEYEFWLEFEIREYEAGTSEYVADVEVAQYGTTMPTIQEDEEDDEDDDEEEDDGVDRTNWSYQDYDDEQDRMEKYVEDKRADALDDALGE
jgi:hypothetical protein